MKHPLVKAGGFTGSRGAGRQLMDRGPAARTQPLFCRDQQHQPGVHPSPALWNALTASPPDSCFVHVRSGSILHQARNGILPEAPTLEVRRPTPAIGRSVSALLLAQRGDPFRLSKQRCRSQGRHGVSVVAEKSVASNGPELGVGAALFETDARISSRILNWKRKSSGSVPC